MHGDRRSVTRFVSRMRLWAALVAIGTTASIAAPDQNALQQPFSELLKNTLQDQMQLAFVPPRDVEDMRRFYEGRAFAPVWVINPELADVAIQTLKQADGEGLNSADYHLDEIGDMAGRTGSGDRLRLEMLLTAEIIRYESDIALGRLHAQVDDSFGRTAFDPVMELSRAASEDGISQFLSGLPPPHPEYQKLKLALARYRAVQLQGGWQVIEDTSGIDLDGRDARVEQLRRRLMAEEPLLPDAAHDRANALLREALIRYQERNRLEPDGKAGKDTLRALNVPVEERIGQVLANMERWRWLPRDRGPRYIEVNSADATLKAVANGDAVLSSRVITGKRRSPTPMFGAAVTAVTVNPFWNIPDAIARNEILPKARRTPNYLASQHIEITNAPGNDPDDVSQRNFPYVLRQRPGSDNALGQLKLEMPNRFNVYLHDTPSRGLFAKADRHFSHGCIRVEQIMPLASLVLTGDADTGQEKLKSAIAAGATQQFLLDKPWPVYVVYWTAIASPDGTAGFRSDIYGRDAQVLAALAGHAGTGLSLNTSPNTGCSKSS